MIEYAIVWGDDNPTDEELESERVSISPYTRQKLTSDAASGRRSLDEHVRRFGWSVAEFLVEQSDDEPEFGETHTVRIWVDGEPLGTWLVDPEFLVQYRARKARV